MSEDDAGTTRGLIRSMAIIGSAQAITIVISILRIKVLALLLGPPGIGLLSIYNSLQGMAATAAGLGMGSSGVRQIASAKGHAENLGRVRRVLFAAHLLQGAMAMLALWLLRAPLSQWLFGHPDAGTEVGLVGLAVWLGLLGTAQTALLHGLRRIGDLGRVTVLSTLAGTAAGLAAVWAYGAAGLIWFVVIQPLATILIASHYTRRLPRPAAPRASAADLWATWKPMAQLGAAFMLSGLMTAATLLVVRERVTHDLGWDAAGYFAAAWGISMTYVGFLLGAMAADYYPRLTEVIHEPARANRLMNDQVQLGLAIGGRVLLVLIGLAPWVIGLLYSAEFAPAAELVQWQSVGNVFKLASWALSFAIVAAARSKTFFLLESSFNVVFLALIWLLLPVLGLQITGMAFLAAYAVYFAVAGVLAHRLQGFRWQPLSLGLMVLHVALALCLLALARTAPPLAAAASVLLALATGVYGVRVVLSKVGPEGKTAKRLARAFAAAGWPISRAP